MDSEEPIESGETCEKIMIIFFVVFLILIILAVIFPG